MNFFELKYLKRIDFRVLPLIFSLMAMSLIIMSEANSLGGMEEIVEEPFWTPLALSQLKWFFMGMVAYLLAASFDYNKLREWAWLLYVIMIFALAGLFFYPTKPQCPPLVSDSRAFLCSTIRAR